MSNKWRHCSTRWFSTIHNKSPYNRTQGQIKGLSFEKDVAHVLKSISCNVNATQMSNDGGIDHHGTWKFPDNEFDVITQCKNENKVVGIHYLREFLGVLTNYRRNTIGIFASASGFSSQAQRYFYQMKVPVVICTINNQSLTSLHINSSMQDLIPNLTIATFYKESKPHFTLMYGKEILGDDCFF